MGKGKGPSPTQVPTPALTHPAPSCRAVLGASSLFFLLPSTSYPPPPLPPQQQAGVARTRTLLRQDVASLRQLQRVGRCTDQGLSKQDGPGRRTQNILLQATYGAWSFFGKWSLSIDCNQYQKFANSTLNLKISCLWDLEIIICCSHHRPQRAHTKRPDMLFQ